jgi:hypothetical protein
MATLARESMDNWTTNQSTVTHIQRDRRGTSKRPDYGTLSGNTAARPTNTQLANNLNEAKKTVSEKTKELQEAQDKMSAFVSTNDCCITYADFKAHGLQAAAPIAAEYKRLFIDQKGDYYKVVKANMAARALNPLVAAGMDDLQLKDALSDLSHFGFDELRSRAIKDLINELPVYCDSTNSKMRYSTNLQPPATSHQHQPRTLHLHLPLLFGHL